MFTWLGKFWQNVRVVLCLDDPTPPFTPPPTPPTATWDDVPEQWRRKHNPRIHRGLHMIVRSDGVLEFREKSRIVDIY